MTRTLRARHRRAAVALGVVLPAALAGALAARPAALPAAPLGIATLDAAPPSAGELRTIPGRDGALGIAVRLARSGDGVALDLAVRSDVGQPETLAFWSVAGRTAAGGDTAIRAATARPLPDAAVLLGPVDFRRTRRFALPAAALDAPGTLILYRIAQGSVAAAVPLPPPDAPEGGGASS